MDSSVPAQDENRFLGVCHHFSNAVYKDYFLGSKGGRCLELTTLSSVLKSVSLTLLETSVPVLWLLYLYRM